MVLRKAMLCGDCGLTCIGDGITEPQHQSISGMRQPSSGLSAHQSVTSYRLVSFHLFIPQPAKVFFPWPWPKPALSEERPSLKVTYTSGISAASMVQRHE